MDPKLTLTAEYLQHLGLASDNESVRKCLFLWWQNPSLKGNRSLRLTSQGFESLTSNNIVKFTKIEVPDTVKITNQLVIWLDRYINCPFYLNKRDLFISNDYIAVQIIMYNGNIYEYCKAKTA